MSENLGRLRTMSMEDLIKKHDQVATHGAVSVAHYLSEISRRDNQLINDRMLNLTRWITLMTVVVTAATIVNVIIVVLSVAH